MRPIEQQVIDDLYGILRRVHERRHALQATARVVPLKPQEQDELSSCLMTIDELEETEQKLRKLYDEYR